MSRTVVGRIASVALALVISLIAGAQPVQAEPAASVLQRGSRVNHASTLTTCYGGAVRSVFQTGGWGGDAGPYSASYRCQDINVRNDSSYGTQACVVFIDRTNSCNYWTYLPAKSSWLVVATNVRDGARFKVRFSNSFYQYDPLIAYIAY